MNRTARRLLFATSAAALLAGCYSRTGNESTETAAAAPVIPLPTQCDTPTTPFCSSTVPLPAGWTGNVFRLAQNYPQTPPTDARPWLRYDPRTQPMQYIRSVLAYFYQGNIRPSVEASFDPALNHARGWYNAPWQDQGFNGREPIHGLTRERVTPAGELDRCQTLPWNNYAVGFYNGAGATTLGRIWANHGQPDPTMAIMPEGTVGAKLLFTTAPVAQAPYLAGSPTWNAMVYDPNYNPPPGPPPAGPPPPRSLQQLRLLQIDIAVKDNRVPTGWVFGTFVYGGGPQGDAPCPPASTTPDPVGRDWNGVQPIGLMWGNDPGYSGSGPLAETWLNPAVHMPHVGYQGRLNGPVDNPASSCLSCHSTAQWPSAASMIPPTSGDIAPWFRNIASGTPFGYQPPPSGPPPAPPQSLDYSLQVQVGFRNFTTRNAAANPSMPSATRAALTAELRDTATPRNGATTD
jgi:hypothetical protein